MAYCCSIVSVEDFCTVWRKGMRRVWSLPANTNQTVNDGVAHSKI